MKTRTILCYTGVALPTIVSAFISLEAVSVAIPRMPRLVDIFQNEEQQYRPVVPVAEAVPTVSKYQQAVQIIDECALREEPSPQVYQAVRFIEKNAYKLYPDLASKEALWERAQGNFKFILSTGDAKTRAFHTPQYPFPFSYAMIRGEHFGNGFGFSGDFIVVSCLQKHYFNAQIRQMVVTVTDMYVGGHKATQFVPKFIKDALNLGKTPEDFAAAKDKAPAFCIVAATEHALVCRGNQSGALAIWIRFLKDIRLSAYRGLVEEQKSVSQA